MDAVNGLNGWVKVEGWMGELRGACGIRPIKPLPNELNKSF